MSRKSRYSEHDMEVYSFQHYLSGGTNDKQREKMKRFILKALDIELTPRQKQCIYEYYINEKKMKDVAKDVGLCISTVSFHISQGMKKIQRRAEYIR